MSRRQLDRPGPSAEGSGDDTGCSILHVDMDAFYASVEVRSWPELAGRPVIVGGLGPRSVVLSATYEARAFGVHSAMPMGRARRLCPHATVVTPHHESYADASRAIMAVFRAITPLVEPLALDEAFLDVAGARRRLGSPRHIAELIREQVRREQDLTCSVGVAPSKFVAKLASARAKPDGLLVVPRDEVVAFLHPLPVSALWGVGDRTEEVLARLGLSTIGDLANTPVHTLRHALGAAAGGHLAALAWGRDDRAVVPRDVDKSIGAEETFAHDVADPTVVRRELLRLAERTAARLRASDQVGRTVVIKVRFADFTTITRSKTLTEATDVAHVVYDNACRLYDALGLERSLIRLVGVRVEGLSRAATTPRQLAIGDRGEHWRAAEQASDRAARRFGVGAVRPAALVDHDRGGTADQARATND
jgi:DNA polymerase IV